MGMRRAFLSSTIIPSIAFLSGLVSGAAFAQSDDDEKQSVDEIVVTGRAQEYYLESSPSLGNKFPANVREIPQSIQILSEQLIKDQAAVEITDLYRNISSVSIFSYSGVTFRGFRQDEIRYDGLLGDPFAGLTVPLLFDIEQVEVIKGPSGALFGGGEPGGLINYVTKRPSDTLSGYATGVVGNFNLFGGRADISGPIDKNEQFFFRLAGAYENADTFRFNTNAEDIIVAADFEWRPSAATNALLRFDYVEKDFQGARLRGVPVDDDGNFLTDIGFNTNEETDFLRLSAAAFTFSLDHRFSDNFSVTVGARYVDSDEAQEYHEPRGVFTNENGIDFVRREFRDQERGNTQFSVLAETVTNFELATTRHTLLFGGEYFRVDGDNVNLTSADSSNNLPLNFIVPDVALINPVYGLSNPDNFDPFLRQAFDGIFDQYAIYLQDQIEITDQLTISLGGRYESYTEELTTETSILTVNLDLPEVFATDGDDAFTIRTGIVYRPVETVSTYFNYSTGFVPQGAFTQDVNNPRPVDPERGRLLEVGTKIDLVGDTIYAQLAAYQINKTDIIVLTSVPGEIGDSFVQIGEARSRGIELDIVGDITTDLTFTLNYAFNETIIIDGDGAGLNTAGDEFVNAPDHQFGFWTRYNIPEAFSPSIGGDFVRTAVSFGGEYVSERVAFQEANFPVQRARPYAIFDAALITEWKNLQFQINARNLFDKVYAQSGFLRRTGHFPGEPRTIRAEITARF
ncbi:MAG: TonB-dependent siderophore receptor [Pseudomonadota bacterium]